MKGCSSNLEADKRREGSRWRHREMKSLNCGEAEGGASGG